MKRNSVSEFERIEMIEIYNALCCLNVSIRKKQPKRAKRIQKLIEEVAELIK